MSIREAAHIEQPAMKFAKERGWFHIKIMQASKRGFPDRFLAREGRILLIEFKAPGEPLSKSQEKRHKELLDAGIIVRVIDNLGEAKRVLR